MKGKTKLQKDKKLFGIAGTASGAGSIISAHNVCHAVCLAVVAFLSIFGIIVSSDVLMWLENYNLFFWSMGIMFLGISLILYYKMPCCISQKLIIFNTGLIIIGIPFFQNMISWSLGNLITTFSIGWYLRNKFFQEVKM